MTSANASLLIRGLARGWYFLLFVGFFGYWAGISVGIITQFLGGYTPAASALCIAAFAIIACFHRRWRVNAVDVMLLFFMVAVAIRTGWGYAVMPRHDVMESNVSMLLQWGAVYLVFRHLDDSKSTVKVCFFSYSIMGACTLWTFFRGISESALAVDLDNIPTYQAFGSYFVLCALLALSMSKSSWASAFVAISSLIVLVVVGARSELVLFLVGLLVILIRRATLRSLAAQLSIIFVLATILSPFAELLEKTRIYMWIDIWRERGDVIQDPLRPALSADAMRIISEYPIWGYFAYYEPGRYAHNVLSLWAEFGVFTFVLYIVLLGVGLWETLRKPAHVPSTNLVARDFGLALWVGIAVLLLSVKSHGYIAVAVALGVASSISNQRRNHVREKGRA